MARPPAGSPGGRRVDPVAQSTTREQLMALHAAARARRDAAVLGSEEFRLAAEEVARIEIAIAALEEPPAPAVE